MPARKCFVFTLVFAGALGAMPLHASDVSCQSLVSAGSKMICPGFEPNWAVELVCSGEMMTSNFIDAFSGDEIATTPGTVRFSSQNPWRFATSHGVEGTIAATPGACRDESDRAFDYTLKTHAVPGYDGRVAPICCRLE